jgi:hypothetical protein
VLPRPDTARKGATPPERPPQAGDQALVLPTPWPGTGDRGFYLWNSHGIYAAHDAQTDLSIPNNAVGTTIYAPTSMPAGGSCVETVTAHYRYSGMASTVHGHGFWDHCVANGWVTFETMDATWQGKYVRTMDGEGRYFTQVYRTSDGCWNGELYNYSLGRWEQKARVCGTWSRTDGWTMWESHYLMDVAKACPSFPHIRSSSIQILTSGGWQFLGTSSTYQSQLGPSGMCWTNGTYQFRVNVANHDWTARTP